MIRFILLASVQFSCTIDISKNFITFRIIYYLYFIQEHLLTIESQEKDIKKSENIVNNQSSEINILTQKLDTINTTKENLEHIISELKDEKITIQEQLKLGDDSAKVLEEYKKRAQLALKKVKSSLNLELFLIRITLFFLYMCFC